MPGGRGKSGSPKRFLEALFEARPHLSRSDVNSRFGRWLAEREGPALTEQRKAHLVSSVWKAHWVSSKDNALAVVSSQLCSLMHAVFARQPAVAANGL